jgi:hypothetical protein
MKLLGERYEPLPVTLLETRAKANARGMQTGRAEDDGVRCHYYPNSKTYCWWLFSRKRPKTTIVEHFRFQESFRKQA